ncbi:MAG: hypothetical protein JWR04_418 [Rhodoglobus sp.]|jgi:hypothetical protein|nr:hypothetical protein [Rhodoglobus sp.]
MIRVTGAGIVFEGADGTVVDFVSSFQDADLLVSELEDVLGVAPVPYPTSEPLYLYVESGTTAWNFGGLIVADQGSGGYGGRAFKLIATVPSIGGVAIVTSGGFTIGDPIADTTSFFGQAPHFYDNDYAGTGTQNSYSDGTYTMQNPKVSVVAEGRSTIISLIIAPTGG